MIYFTSDTHFNHTKIIQYCERPFDSVEEMNKTIITNWNSVVKEDDTIYHLGDFCFGNPNDWLPLLSGKIILVRGNHDKRMYKLFDIEKHKSLPMKIGEFNCILHHKPEIHEEKKKLFDYIICGHVHEKWLVKDNAINVGTDVHNFFPISIEKVEKMINGLRGM